MAESSPNPFDAIADDLADLAREFSRRVEARVQENLSVPVEYVGGGVIRSKEGEHPRRETGNLRGSTQARVRRPGPGEVAVELDSAAGYAERLQLEMNRPITNNVPGEFEDDWLETCARAIRGG